MVDEPLDAMESPAAPDVQATPATPKRRGRGIDRSALKASDPEKFLAHKRAIDLKSKRKSRDKEKKASFVYDSSTEPTKPEAKELLAARGLQNPHIIDFCYDLALVAAEQNDLPANRFLFQNGLRKTLESHELGATQTLEPIPSEEVPGELLNRAELHCLWCFGFWRQPDVTFEQWLADRLKFKLSAFELSKILGKEDFGAVHEEWTNFAPRWNPLGLRPGYTQREALDWLDAQSSTKRFLLIASRNSMKSTWARILALTLVITYPDSRILYVTETNKLSRKAMKELKGYLEMTPNSPSLFQQYFGEFTVAPGSGQALTYDNPLARLNLPQHSIEQSSAESSNTGSRFDFCIFDDFVSRDYGTSNEEQRATAVAAWGSIMRLREPSGCVLNIQTPWVPGDLGDVMIQRNNEDPEHPLAVRIDTVMTVKPEAKQKGLLELQEEDVVLNFLPKLNWKFVRNELRSPEGLNFFRSQYLCEWVPDDSTLDLLNFDRLALQRATLAPSAAPPMGPLVIFGDIAHSTRATADRSAFAVSRITTNIAGEKCMTIVDVVADRMRSSQFADKLAQLCRQWNPQFVCLERTPTWDLLAAEIYRAANNYQIVIPLTWVQPPNVRNAKFLRLKGLEGLLAAGRLQFVSGPYIDSLFDELERLDGTAGGSSTRHDDRADAIGWTQKIFCPAIHFQETKAKATDEEEDTAIRAAKKRAHYDRMFGPQWTPQPPKPSVVDPTPAKPSDPRLSILPRGFRL